MMRIASVAALSAAFALGGCAQLGGLGEVLGDVLAAPPASGEIQAEVETVDTQNRQIQVVTQDGQRGGVAYDQRTQVVYRNQEYPVTALERGDLVRMRVQDTGQALYTDYVLVEQSVRERTGQTGATQTIEGRVGRVDQQQAWFELIDTWGTTIMVTLPFNPHTTDVNRFRALRGGENVRVSGRWVTQTRFELERFL